MPSITKQKTGYRAQVYVRGKRDSKVFRTQREASAWAARRETELRMSKDSPADFHTISDAMRKYSLEVSPHKRGHRWETIRIEALSRSLPNLPLSQITSDILGQWRNARLKQVSPGTVLREFTLISAIFECARREWGWIDANPVKDVRKPPMPDHREVIITRRQIRLMLESMGYVKGDVKSVSQAVSVAFLLALRTGMRAGEICGLKWCDVFDGYCKVTGKTGRRDVPLTSKAERIILSIRGYDPVYVLGLTSQSMDAMFRKYRKRAGLEGFTFHDTRHTAATWIAQKIHVLDLCKMFGWSNTTRALTYYNPKAKDIANRLS